MYFSGQTVKLSQTLGHDSEVRLLELSQLVQWRFVSLENVAPCSATHFTCSLALNPKAEENDLGKIWVLQGHDQKRNGAVLNKMSMESDFSRIPI